jgi:hypothetical protein
MDSRGKNREFMTNGPDIIIKNKQKKREKSCILIDMQTEIMLIKKLKGK